MAQAPNKGREIHLEKLLAQCREQVRTLQEAKADAKASESKHPITTYIFRNLGIVSILWGAAGIMIGVSFPVWAWGIAVGLVLLMLDPWVEPQLKGRSWIVKTIFTCVFLTGLISFLHWIVFLPAPLKLTARDYNGNYLPRTKSLFGIEWKENYSDLRVVFGDSTNFAYKNLDFNIEPVGLVVAAATQTTNLSGVQIFNTMNGPDVVTATQTDKNGQKSYLPQDDTHLMAGTIRVLCDTLPKNTNFELVLAVTVVPKGVPVSNALRPTERFKLRQPAQKVRIYGVYESRGGKPHNIDVTIPVELD